VPLRQPGRKPQWLATAWLRIGWFCELELASALLAGPLEPLVMNWKRNAIVGLMIPLMIAAAGLWLSGAIASLVSAIPLRWLVAAQVYRIGGGIFLVLWADGRLPWQFALPAGIGDVMTGVLAVFLAARRLAPAARPTLGAFSESPIWS
jgi:hypothetical protein